MLSTHSAHQDNFDNLQLASTRTSVELEDGPDSYSRCCVLNADNGSVKKTSYAEFHDEAFSAEMLKLLELLGTEQRKMFPVSCDHTRQSTGSSFAALPPPMKFCRKAKSPVPVR
jgi:hypothetical protein